jgi:hypothetical protein
MIKSDLFMIRRIAKAYRLQHPSYTLRKAVVRAFEAYGFFKEAEVAEMDNYYEKEYNETVRF